jgi:hypothetical protein
MEDKDELANIFGKIQKVQGDAEDLLKSTRSLKYDGYLDVCVLLDKLTVQFGGVVKDWDIIKHDPYEQTVEFFLNVVRDLISRSDLIKHRDRIEQISLSGQTVPADTGQSKPLGVKDWATIFEVGKNKMREMMNGPDYHFKKVGGEKGRKWTLPINELPVEYLVQYRSKK